jgi:hypothetical protein
MGSGALAGVFMPVSENHVGTTPALTAGRRAMSSAVVPVGHRSDHAYRSETGNNVLESCPNLFGNDCERWVFD